MKNIEINGKNIDLKTTLSDITIQEFEKYLEIFQEKNLDNIDKYVKILSILSNLTQDEIEDLPTSMLQNLISSIEISDFTNEDKTESSFEGKVEIEIEGVKYRTNSDGITFEISTKETSLLLKSFNLKKNPIYISNLASIIFKEVDANGNVKRDYSDAALLERKEKFKNIKMDIMAPYLIELSKRFTLQNA